MALVAYDGSGSSSGSEDEEDPPVPVPATLGGSSTTSTLKRDSDKASAATNGGGATGSGPGGVKVQPRVGMFSRFIDDDEEDDNEVPSGLTGDDGDGEGEDSVGKIITKNSNPTGDGTDGGNPIWSKFLPQPKKVPVVEEDEMEDDVEIGPIPPKKTYGDEELPPSKSSSVASLTSTKVKGKVRISIPFLNSLEEDEPYEDVKKKYVEPSKKGSGLFALLPQPKNARVFDDSTTNMFLKAKIKPQAVGGTSSSGSSAAESNQSAQPSSSQSSATSAVNRLIPDTVKNRLKRPAPGKLEEIRAKFSKRGLPESSATTTSTAQKDSDDSDDEKGDFFSLDETETMDPEALEKLKLPTPNFDKKPEAPVYENMDVEDEYEAQPSSSSRSEELMRFIHPTKKSRKEDVQIIDINADDLRPDNTEWLRNITDESAAPARRGKGLTGAVKRKHQITYLAFEAKAREQELKNQWAQNHANKRATNNKYGF